MEAPFSTANSLNNDAEVDLEEAMTLQSVSNTLPSIKNEFLRVQESITNLNSNSCIVSHSSQMDINHIHSVSSHSKSDDILTAESVLDSEKSLNLANFEHSRQSDIVEDELHHINALNETENTLSLNSNHYYEGLNPTSIMVYQVPSGNIVPFESIVSSVSFGKTTGRDKQDNTVELLQNSLSHDVYDHASETVSQPLYILPNDPNNIFHLDKSSYGRDKCEIHEVSDQLQAEFSLPSSGYDSNNSNLPSSNINQFSMSLSYSASSIDTDSEVALTLASLGNLKNQNIREVIGNEHTIRISDIEEKFHDEKQNEIIISQSISEDKSDPSNENPTLMLQSRKYKGKNETLKKQSVLKEGKKLIKKKKQVKSKQILKSSSQNEKYAPQKENLLGQLLRASKHCEPASLIPEGVVDDVIPSVGYRIMDMSNLSEMIRMMHHCPNSSSAGPIVIQEQASLREGVVSQLSIICTGCQEGAICSTSSRDMSNSWDINSRLEQLSKEFNIEQENIQRMLEILGIFYSRKKDTVQITETEIPEKQKKKKKRKFPKEKTLKCQVCQEMFYGENHLKSHMNTHNNSLHRCPYCQAYFKKTYNLKEHINRHKNCKYECPICHLFYADKSSLYTHIKIVHENKTRLECEICSKKFWIRSHYNEHKRIHTGETPYSCHVCGKSYRWQSSIKKHMKTHFAEPKYKCRLCGKWFKWLLGVRQHLLQQHKLKKCDIEAQVVTAVTETIPERPQQRFSSVDNVSHKDEIPLECRNENVSSTTSRDELESSLNRSKNYTNRQLESIEQFKTTTNSQLDVNLSTDQSKDCIYDIKSDLRRKNNIVQSEEQLVQKICKNSLYVASSKTCNSDTHSVSRQYNVTYTNANS